MEVFHITIMAPRILMWSLDPWNVCVSLAWGAGGILRKPLDSNRKLVGFKS